MSAHARYQLSSGVFRAVFVFVLLTLSACKPAPVVESVTPPPNATCALLAAHEGWSQALGAASQRTGAPAAAILAVIRQESNFEPDKRAAQTPGPYGYAQADARTWAAYQRSQGRPKAVRNDFSDAADFVGWYLSATYARTGLAYDRVAAHYLVYSRGEGAVGPAPPAARRNAARVVAFARVYEKHLAACPPR
jgi:hypothetical protein